jgi:hypothetical protein
MSQPAHAAVAGSAEPFIRGTIIPSRSFAEAMRVLGRVVESDYRFRSPDRSAYQKWLLEQYIKELPDQVGKAARSLPTLLKNESRLASTAARLRSEAERLASGLVGALGEEFLLAQKHYWEWLYEHDRDQWLVLDPVITVTDESLFFEALSADESTYVRVSLPQSAVDISGAVRRGCTNIDYSPNLDRVLSRARSYRPLNIEVSEDGLLIGGTEALANEEKVDPPESWMRSFAEVQAIFGLTPLRVDISPGFLADIIATLRARRTREGPRALLVYLNPGQPVQAELQPWRVTVMDRLHTWAGTEAKTIKVWGRRRLELLAPLLPEAESVSAELLGDGLPSAWTVTRGGIQTTLVLSGWTTRDWAGRASFLGATSVDEGDADAVERHLRAAGSATLAELAATAGLDPLSTQRAVSALSRRGKATLDLTTAKYVARSFPFAPGATSQDYLSLAEKKARELIASGQVTTQVLDLDDGGIEVKGSFRQPSQSVSSVVLDADRRVRSCACTCSDFRFHGMRNGPCSHLIATIGAL